MTHDADANRRPIPARKSSYAIAFAQWLSRHGVGPNQISVFGLAVGTGSGMALCLTSYLPWLERPLLVASAVMVVMRGLSNMFDGMVAVEHHRGTELGMLYNEVPDRISDVALMVGAGYAAGSDPVAGWAAATTALFVTYVRAVCTQAGAPADFGGPMAKQQRMFSLAGASFYLAVTPSVIHPAFGPDQSLGLLWLMLWIIVAGGVVTAALRLRRAARALSGARSG